MPSVRRVGSCSITGSPISSTVVGRTNSSRPIGTRGRSSGHGAVGSSVGSSVFGKLKDEIENHRRFSQPCL